MLARRRLDVATPMHLKRQEALRPLVDLPLPMMTCDLPPPPLNITTTPPHPP